VLFSLASPQEALAQTIFALDCSLGFKNVYFDNEPVCAVVQAGGSVLGGPALVFVVPPGGQPADDVTPGVCNAVGIFLEEPWQLLADWGEYLDEFASAISIAWAVSTGDWLSAAVGVVGVVTGQPTDYNGAVLDQGGQIIAALARTQAGRYASLAADPPDPVFTEFVSMDLAAINSDLAVMAPLKPGVPLQYPFANQIQDPTHLASTALANTMAEEAALVFALMRTLEKFQGAENASDDEFTLLQARTLKKYADQLGTQLATTRQDVLDYKLSWQLMVWLTLCMTALMSTHSSLVC